MTTTTTRTSTDRSGTRRRSVAAVAAAVALAAVAVAACIGSQSRDAQRQSDAVGDRSAGVPRASLRESDWNAAAKGHGAAGRIPPDELAQMERQSAPGGNLPRATPADAGAATAR